jgi:1-acyl-sn-glycerol-3-phosphate acyltransferase
LENRKRMYFHKESKPPSKRAKLAAVLGTFKSSFWPLFWLIYFFISIAVIGGTLTFGLYIPFTIIGIVITPFNSLANFVLKHGVRFLLFAQPWLDLKAQVIDPPLGKRPGTLLVANHRSTLDVYLLLASISGIRIFTNRRLLWALPLVPMIIASRQILVRQGDARDFLDGMQRARKKLAHGENVHVFPELTRCTQGFQGPHGFTVAPFLAAFQEKAMVVPIVIKGSDSVWPKGIFGLFSGPVEIRSLGELDPLKFSSADALRAEARKRIDEALA